MGGLHDSVVKRIVWDANLKTLEFEIEDLCSNFEGFPEYPGSTPGTIVLEGIDRVAFQIDTQEKRLNIYEFLVSDDDLKQHCATVSFRPSGRIAVYYRVADFPEIKLRRQS